MDTAPLDEALVMLRALLPLVPESHAEAQLAGVITTLEQFGREVEEHVCEPPDIEGYYSLAEPAR